jgi:hypothetical protein
MTMGKELKFPDDTPDQVIGRAIEPLLAPPSDDDAYWGGLHRRIMAHVAEGGSSVWWNISPITARAGLIAAGLALFALGALYMQSREVETRMAFQSVTETELEIARIIPGLDEPYTPVWQRTPAAPGAQR